MKIQRKEAISFYTHLCGAIAAVPGTAALVLAAKESPSHIVVALVYGLSVFFLFMASTLYHAFKKRDNEVSLWRKLDHIAIFIMIAGSYTPFCYVYLDDPVRWIIIGIQWGLVFAGLFFKLFYLNAPRLLNTLIYIMMGWCILFVIGDIYRALPFAILAAVFGGGLAYSVGATMYGLKRPDPLPGFFGFHELFHLFILLGGLLQFAGVYLALSGSLI